MGYVAHTGLLRQFMYRYNVENLHAEGGQARPDFPQERSFMPHAVHADILAVTRRITERSRASRQAYLARCERAQAELGPLRGLSCANLAHGFAALPAHDKLKLRVEHAPNLGVVTAYNDMLSAHQPYERYPGVIREAARAVGAVAQVAGGVPGDVRWHHAGNPGMELSLFRAMRLP
ncbi:hypothetical protein AWV80_34940 [Cupriavidus sp. UYMU48A]|nr:hypothetical protein AWV80_34940 [Cupriavidus sp. UYMU48A]